MIYGYVVIFCIWNSFRYGEIRPKLRMEMLKTVEISTTECTKPLKGLGPVGLIERQNSLFASLRSIPLSSLCSWHLA